MKNLTPLYVEYDDLMIKKRAYYSNSYFRYGKGENEENALAVIKYAFTRYLRWPPEVIAKRLNHEIMEKLHLLSLMQYIDYPIEYKKDKDYYYLVTLVYHRHRLTFRDKTIHTYEKIISGEIPKYPKEYFVGSEGQRRAHICLQYLINNYLDIKTINELYHFFATRESFQMLRKYRLNSVCRDIFDTPVDYFHYTLPYEKRNEFLYHFYKFKMLTQLYNENGKRQKSNQNYLLKTGGKYDFQDP